MNTHIAECLEAASWIRRMFEQGAQMREQFGAENVYDFSLGNPHLEPPAEFVRRLKELADDPPPGLHRYMPNPGFADVREKVAAFVSRQQQTPTPASHIVMTCGAASALNVALRALLEPGDEVVLFRPIFAEYTFYIMHAQGKRVLVDTSSDFDLDPGRLADAVTEKTRAVMINSPNNPTGRVYPESTIDQVCDVLREKSSQFGRAIALISDEPYRRLVYDGVTVPPLFPKYEHSIIAASFSKDLGLAGDRIGYLALHPGFEDAGNLLAAMIFCLRTLGFVNAPAIIQKAVADVLDASVDVDAYRQNRDLLHSNLTEFGYRVDKPQGAFYLFPHSPIDDDVKFIDRLRDQRILAVPGTGFAQPGYFRLSYAVDSCVIERALPGFEAAIRD